jgi:hypothetical protein
MSWLLIITLRAYIEKLGRKKINVSLAHPKLLHYLALYESFNQHFRRHSSACTIQRSFHTHRALKYPLLFVRQKVKLISQLDINMLFTFN